MADAFADIQTGAAGPAKNASSVTPDDNTNLTNPARALWVGTPGDVEVDTAGGQEAVVLKGVSGLLPVMVVRVRATNTTAEDIVALY